MARKPKLSAFYKAYIKSSAWRARSRACIAIAGGRCQSCGKGGTRFNPLQAHHLCYDRLGAEPQCDLQCLCKRCHALADALRRKASSVVRSRFGR